MRTRVCVSRRTVRLEQPHRSLRQRPRQSRRAAAGQGRQNHRDQRGAVRATRVRRRAAPGAPQHPPRTWARRAPAAAWRAALVSAGAQARCKRRGSSVCTALRRQPGSAKRPPLLPNMAAGAEFRACRVPVATFPAALPAAHCQQQPARGACEGARGSEARHDRRGSSGQGVESGVCVVLKRHHAAPPSDGFRAGRGACGVICADLRSALRACLRQTCAAVAASRAAPSITACKAASAHRAAQGGWNSLIAASENGHDKTIELLLDRRADINAADRVLGARHANAGGQAAQGAPGR